jgi:hypothetical protein
MLNSSHDQPDLAPFYSRKIGGPTLKNDDLRS